MVGMRVKTMRRESWRTCAILAPVGLVLCLMAYVCGTFYFSAMAEFLEGSTSSLKLTLLLVGILHVGFMGMVLWSYFKVVFTNPGYTWPELKLERQDILD